MKVIEDFACTLCSCVCDDLRLSVSGGRIVRAEKACRLAEPWLLGQDSAKPPAAEIDGRPVFVRRCCQPRGRHTGRRAVPADLRPVPQQHGRPARGRASGRSNRGHDRHDRLARARPVGDGRAAGGRIDLHAGRGQKPLRSRDLLGLRSGRNASTPLGTLRGRLCRSLYAARPTPTGRWSPSTCEKRRRAACAIP